jgi:hypothetical protein
MPKTDTWEIGLLDLLFQNTSFGTVAAAGSLSNLYVSLHTASPTDSGTQVTNEATYTGYARVAVARTSGGWTVGENASVASASNAAQVLFAQCTGGSSTVTYVGVGTTPSTNVTSGSNGQSLSAVGFTLNVGSTTGFASSGTIQVWNGTSYTTVTYTNTAGGNQFTGCSGGTGTASTGFAVTQTGQLLYYGTLASSLAISQNITPSFGIGALVVTED